MKSMPVLGLCLLALGGNITPSVSADLPACYKVQVGNTLILSPWVNSTSLKTEANSTTTAAAYGIFKNIDGDRLMEASSPVCDRVELHTHIQEGNVMKMRPVQAIDIDDYTELKRGGYHLMLIGLKRPLKPGEFVPMTFLFERSGEITLDIPVRRRPPAPCQ